MTSRNYSSDKDTQENQNFSEKYDISGESEFSRENTIPLDEEEQIIDRSYSFKDQAHRKDADIKDDVSEALYRSPEVDATDIEVRVEKGEVTLLGFVSLGDQIKFAEGSIQNVPGLAAIYNYLKVKAPYDENRAPGPNGLIDNITGLN